MSDQQDLFKKILAQTLSPDATIAVYQRNRWATAERALSISFPTVHQLLGDGFGVLARKFLFFAPNNQADWGEWGGKLPEFIKSTPLDNALPYLSDCATLDWHIHNIERNDNSIVDSASFTKLEHADSEYIYLMLNENIALMESQYPLFSLWKMHQNQNTDYWRNMANRQLNGSSRDTEYIAVFRNEWKAKPMLISQSEYRFMQHILNEQSLVFALDQVSQTDFDFSQWLLRAIKSHWISSISQRNLNS